VAKKRRFTRREAGMLVTPKGKSSWFKEAARRVLNPNLVSYADRGVGRKKK